MKQALHFFKICFTVIRINCLNIPTIAQAMKEYYLKKKKQKLTLKIL